MTQTNEFGEGKVACARLAEAKGLERGGRRNAKKILSPSMRAPPEQLRTNKQRDAQGRGRKELVSFDGTGRKKVTLSQLEKGSNQKEKRGLCYMRDWEGCSVDRGKRSWAGLKLTKIRNSERGIKRTPAKTAKCRGSAGKAAHSAGIGERHTPPKKPMTLVEEIIKALEKKFPAWGSKFWLWPQIGGKKSRIWKKKDLRPWWRKSSQRDSRRGLFSPKREKNTVCRERGGRSVGVQNAYSSWLYWKRTINNDLGIGEGRDSINALLIYCATWRKISRNSHKS